MSVNETNHAITWMVTYPVDSAIHLSSNPSKMNQIVQFHSLPLFILTAQTRALDIPRLENMTLFIKLV